MRLIHFMAFCLFVSACAGPFAKVTDPTQPGFDTERFNFRDYTEEDLLSAARYMFPPGTSRENVEHVLVDVGKAFVSHDQLISEIHPDFDIPHDSRLVKYFATNPKWTYSQKSLWFVYDPNRQVVMVPNSSDAGRLILGRDY